MMNIRDLSNSQVSELVHTRVMEKAPEPCTDGQLDPYMGSYWRCSCGWESDFCIGEGSTDHMKPIPNYSESLDVILAASVQHFDHIELHRKLWNERTAFYQAFVWISATHVSYESSSQSVADALCRALLKAKGVIDDVGQVIEIATNKAK